MDLENFLVILRNRLVDRVCDIVLEFLFGPLLEACLEQQTLVSSLDWESELINQDDYLLNDHAVSIGALKNEDYSNMMWDESNNPYLRRSIQYFEVLLKQSASIRMTPMIINAEHYWSLIETFQIREKNAFDIIFETTTRKDESGTEDILDSASAAFGI